MRINKDSNYNELKFTKYNLSKPESEEELKSLLMKVKEESEKAGLKLSMEYLSSLTRDQTSAPCNGSAEEFPGPPGNSQ